MYSVTSLHCSFSFFFCGQNKQLQEQFPASWAAIFRMTVYGHQRHSHSSSSSSSEREDEDAHPVLVLRLLWEQPSGTFVLFSGCDFRTRPGDSRSLMCQRQLRNVNVTHEYNEAMLSDSSLSLINCSVWSLRFCRTSTHENVPDIRKGAFCVFYLNHKRINKQSRTERTRHNTNCSVFLSVYCFYNIHCNFSFDESQYHIIYHLYISSLYIYDIVPFSEFYIVVL